MAPELASTPGALYLHRKRLTLKGAATDPVLAGKVWATSEKQTGMEPGTRR
jgi:hypothetical protein